MLGKYLTIASLKIFDQFTIDIKVLNFHRIHEVHSQIIDEKMNKKIESLTKYMINQSFKHT